MERRTQEESKIEAVKSLGCEKACGDRERVRGGGRGDIQVIKAKKWRKEEEQERWQEGIDFLCVNLVSKVFFGLRTVNRVIIVGCQRSGVFIPFI